MTVLMVRSKIRAEAVDDVDAAVERLFAAIHHAQPDGIRYASGRLPDGVTYVAMLALDEGVDNPLPTLPEFQEFQQNLAKWTAEPPIGEPLTVVGSYRLF